MRNTQQISDMEDFEIAELFGVIDVVGIRKRLVGYTLHSYLESGGEFAPKYDRKWFSSKSKARDFVLKNYGRNMVAEITGDTQGILNKLREKYKSFFTEQKAASPFLVECAE